MTIQEREKLMSAIYEINSDRDAIIIRLPRGLMNEQELSKLLDYIEMEAIRRQSQLSEEDANTLANEIQEGAWQQVKHLFVE